MSYGKKLSRIEKKLDAWMQKDEEFKKVLRHDNTAKRILDAAIANELEKVVGKVGEIEHRIKCQQLILKMDKV